MLVIGGAPGKTGAAVLAGRAAFRAGAGLVTIGARADARAALEEKVIELMTAALPEQADQAAVEALCEGKRAVVLGPGMGLDELGAAGRAPLRCMHRFPPSSMPTVSPTLPRTGSRR